MSPESVRSSTSTYRRTVDEARWRDEQAGLIEVRAKGQREGQRGSQQVEMSAGSGRQPRRTGGMQVDPAPDHLHCRRGDQRETDGQEQHTSEKVET